MLPSKRILSWCIKDLQVEFATFNFIESSLSLCASFYITCVYFCQFVSLVTAKYQTQASAVFPLYLDAHCYGDSSRRECCQGSFKRFLCLWCNYFYYLVREGDNYQLLLV